MRLLQVQQYLCEEGITQTIITNDTIPKVTGIGGIFFRLKDPKKNKSVGW